jgi:hypothetical protein
MDDDVNALMGEADEAIWRQAGLFTLQTWQGLMVVLMRLGKRLRLNFLRLCGRLPVYSCFSPVENARGPVSCAPENTVVKGLVNPREDAGVKSGGQGRVSGEASRGRFAGVKKGLGPRQFKHWVPNRTKRKLMLG